MLRKFLLRRSPGRQICIKQDRPAGGGALVDGQDVGGQDVWGQDRRHGGLGFDTGLQSLVLLLFENIPAGGTGPLGQSLRREYFHRKQAAR